MLVSIAEWKNVALMASPLCFDRTSERARAAAGRLATLCKAGIRRLELLDTECVPEPLARFRVLFYLGLVVHFVPLLWTYSTTIGANAMGITDWDPVVHRWLLHGAPWSVVALGCIAAIGLTLGLVGAASRVAALVSLVGLYGLCCIDSVHTQTLALPPAWSVLLAFCVFGGGTGAYCLTPRHARGTETRVAPIAVLAPLILSVFLAGLEKVHAGWLEGNEMAVLLNYPKHTMLRAWVVGLIGTTDAAGRALGSMVLVVELVCPVLALFARTRGVAALSLGAFFLGVGCTMLIPPLFIAEYLGLAVSLWGFRYRSARGQHP